MGLESEEPIINQCPECRQDLDVTELSPFSKIVCPYCGAAVRVRTRLGQYEITSMLGEGGMSQVFLANDLTLGRKVALKILHHYLTQDSKLTEMFEREATLTASINHPNVVKVYTVGSENGYFYIAMELVDAVSVEQMIVQKGALPEKKVLDILHGVVCGLRAAFQANLIHRDIKPGNMLMTKDGVAKLVDFGLAVTQGGAEENEDLWATPFYVPPEKLIREPDTYLGDIYALGATGFHAIAGQPPFEANTSSLEELIDIKSAGVDLKAVAPQCSKKTVELIEKMMAYSAKDRPNSYDQLLKLIEDCQGKGGLAGGGHVLPQTGGRSWLGIGLAGAAVVAVAAFFLLRGGGGNSELDSLLGKQGDRVISVEEREAARKMLDGRNAMVGGSFREARQIFTDLEGNESFTQPIRGWNMFNRGLVDLLSGKEKTARDSFAKLAKQSGFDSPEVEPYGEFFSQAGKLLSDPLPVLRSEFNPDEETFETVGLLAAGLKNWHQGQFAEANRFLSDFAGVEAPKSDSWIGQLKPQAQKYLNDFKTVEKLPNPSLRMSKEELEKVKARLRTASQSLQTRGALTELIDARIQRADRFIVSAGQPIAPGPGPDPGPSAPVEKEWSGPELNDLKILQDLVDTFSDYRETYLFSGAALKLEGAQVTTGRGKALRSDLVTGYHSADQFIEGLAERLAQGTYSGIIRRKRGLPLDAKITAANTESFTVDLGFGPNEVEIEKFDPAWLVEAAQATMGAPSTANLPGWKECFWFAQVCGLSGEARSIALKIVDVDQPFKQSGQRFKKITFEN